MVKCWLREAGKTSDGSEYYSILVAVVGASSLQDGNEPVGRTFLNHGKNRNSAKKATGLAANLYIASELVGLPLNGDGGEAGTFRMPREREILGHLNYLHILKSLVLYLFGWPTRVRELYLVVSTPLSTTIRGGRSLCRAQKGR
jgi:hypothetical protein